MTGWPLAAVWAVYVAALAFLAERQRVTWPVATVFAVAALFIAVTTAAGRQRTEPQRRQ